ncbi:hypothetical protein Tco_0658511 [Tanacetum coccineum]
MRENNMEEKVKHDMNEIKTINIELEHSVTKLLSENELLHKEIEHLKKIYKYQFDSIKKTRALSKEHCDSLIAQLNSKSMENVDLKGQIQEKVFVTTTLQNELKRLKGLKHSTSARISQPTGNKKNDRISQTPSSRKKAKIVESTIANNSEPNHSWGSNATDVPSSLLLSMTGTVRFRNDQIAKILGYGYYQLGNVTISRVYYVEGLGHNLFSVRQFCDSNLEDAF